MTSHPVAVTRLKVLLLIAAGIGTIAAVLWVLQHRAGYQSEVRILSNPVESRELVTASPATVSSSPANPEVTPLNALPASTPADGSQLDAGSPIPGTSDDLLMQFPVDANLSLIVPVLGVTLDQLSDTFNASRSEGRKHDAIDIMAPAGTPVLAADDGEIIKLFESKAGGTTIYQHNARAKHLVFYYGHLQRYAEGLAVGKFARKGEVIAYVGDTGNAGTGNYHLHFSVMVVSDPKRHWEGKNINPYPLLRR